MLIDFSLKLDIWNLSQVEAVCSIIGGKELVFVKTFCSAQIFCSAEEQRGAKQHFLRRAYHSAFNIY